MRFLAARLAQLVVVLLAVSAVSFLLLNQLPGNPVVALLGPAATPQAVAQLTRQLGLDRPAWLRYFIWLGNALRGDLGSSYVNHQPVLTSIGQRLPVTLELLALSQVIALALAVPLGIVAALRSGRAFDRLASSASFGLLAVPGFILAELLVYLFAVRYNLFPATGYVHLTEDPLQNLRSLTLPSITLGLGSMAVYMRVLRTDMIATLRQDYITMARSKGLPTWWILLRHALRPSTFTLVTVGGLNVGTLVGGAFIVEYIFQVPGLGLLTINSIYARDYLVVTSTTVLVSAGFVLVNLLVDLLYTFLDPRVRSARFA
ncbi:MAG TPA: ABC transporter permease [Candidatus Dormibacteraeota bacterium]